MRVAGRVAGRVAAAAVVAGMLVTGAPAGALAADTPAAAGTLSAAKAVLTAKTVPATENVSASGPAGVRAPWAELANGTTGAVLWSRAANTERPMGSITKVMTAYLVIKAGKLNRVITVPEGIISYDETYDASTAGLVPGEKLTALQLLYAMLLPSGCDAAYTLATAFGPGRAAFIKEMNATARKLGLTRTHFTDFAGLPDPGQYTTYSTARDLVNLGRDAMKLPLFRKVVDTRVFRVAAGDGHYAHVWHNLDPLLGKVAGVNGIKTGYTAAAGECFLFSATRGKRTLIGVVLDSSPTYSPAGIKALADDATAILNWGFRT